MGSKWIEVPGMNCRLRARVLWAWSAAVAVGLLLGLTGTARAFDYDPTPLAKALRAHDCVLVARVVELAGGRATLEVVRVIKGEVEKPFTLPDTWRPGSQFTFGPVPLAAGKTYLLMLDRTAEGFSLSRDFAAPAVARIDSMKDPLVRTATVLHALSQRRDPESRKSVLARAWDQETDDTKAKILHEFWQNPPDPATVPFLLRASNAGPDRSPLATAAGGVLVKHGYKEATPELLQVLRKREWTTLYAAQALAALKVREAYEPIRALIDDPVVGNRPYLIEALAQLEDPRAVPFFLKTLPRNLPGLDPNYGTYRSWDLRENQFAVVGLGRLRAAEAVEPLVRVLSLEGPGYRKLRSLVVAALGEIGQPARKAVPAIRDLIRADGVDTDVAAEALKKIEQ